MFLVLLSYEILKNANNFEFEVLLYFSLLILASAVVLTRSSLHFYCNRTVVNY